MKVSTDDLKKDLKKMSKLATSLLIDQKALALAQSVENGFDLAKYREEIVKNMASSESDEDKIDLNM